jgi:hypothetical protein
MVRLRRIDHILGQINVTRETVSANNMWIAASRFGDDDMTFETAFAEMKFKRRRPRPEQRVGSNSVTIRPDGTIMLGECGEVRFTKQRQIAGDDKKPQCTTGSNGAGRLQERDVEIRTRCLHECHCASRVRVSKDVRRAADDGDRSRVGKSASRCENVTKHILGQSRPRRIRQNRSEPLLGLCERLDGKNDPQSHALQRNKSSDFGRNNSCAFPSRRA